MPELVNVSKSYKVANTKIEALKNVSLSFDKAEFVSVLGPSGCGKTTLLNVIGGLDRYDSGDLIINGISTKKFKDRDWDTYRNHSIGFVFQSYNLIPHQTVFSNVELALTLAGISKKERRRRVNEALAKVGLSDQANKKPNQMSGGQMQRVAIARALVNDPEILLADEPTGALDSVTSVQIMEILKEISQDRLIIMVTHNPELAEQYSTRIVRLKDGQVVSDTKTAALGGVAEPSVSSTEEPSENIIECVAGNPTANSSETAPEEPSDIAADALADKDPEGTRLSYSDDILAASRRLSAIKDSFSVEAVNIRDSSAAGALDDADCSGAGSSYTGSATADDSDDPVSSAAQGSAATGVDSRAPKVKKTEGTGSATNKGRKKKTSMSFFTALSLSFNNLLTKKGRTFMTSFAGSIGIIGIALILAMSTGINNFINDVQRNTLSSYPISIVADHLDLSTLLSTMSSNEDEKAVREADRVYSNATAYDMFNAFFSQGRKQNNLTSFKKWLDEGMAEGSEKNLSEMVSTIHYGYDTRFKTYITEDGSRYRSTDVSDIFSFSQSEDESGASSLMSSFGGMNSYSLWEELIPGPKGEPVCDLIKEQYDLVYGSWPEKATDVLLVIHRNNDISDLAFYTLGMMSREELTGIISAAMSRSEINVEDKEISFEDVLKVKLKLVLPTELYRDSDNDGIYDYIGNSEDMVSLIVKNCPELNICGIIRKNPDVTAAAIGNSTVFAYTNMLTEMLISKTAETDVAKAFIESEDKNLDIFTGLPFVPDFRSLTEAEKAEAVAQKSAEYTDEQKAEKYQKIIKTPDRQYIEDAVKSVINITDREEAEKLIAETYGMDVSVIRNYLDSYTDEELFEMLYQTAERYVTEQYEKQAQDTIDAVISTPSEEELTLIKAYIGSQLPDRQTQTGFVAKYWESIDVMSAEEAFGYLVTLDDAAFLSLYEKALGNSAEATYKEAQQSNPSVSLTKLSQAYDRLIAGADDAKKAEYYDILISDEISPSTYADYRSNLGIADVDSPSSINIYPATFENKDKIASLIAEYNDYVPDDDKISYTDFVAIAFSSITIIINVISYVLIAFVAVSLVVSSIMIGIITYISVLERTKEIGILRSIGASKRDVSRVFTAETLIIGLISGLIGIGVAALLCIPANIIIHELTGFYGINATLPWIACIVLVIISMLLTLIAGLFPSSSAAHKDPVEALRTE